MLSLQGRVCFTEKDLHEFQRWTQCRLERKRSLKFVSTQEIPSLVAGQNYREEMAVVLWQITPFDSIFSRQEQNSTSVVGCMQGF